MKALVTGVKGQLGFDVVNELKNRGHDAVGVDIEEMDITDPESVSRVIGEAAPDVVIHCAAWTAVDAAEDPENIAKVRAVNAGGTRNIAQVCKKLDCKMMYISTDYVFNGQGTQPWQPDCRDYAPLNVYGQTKLEGELAVADTLEKYFIVRIAWVFGKNGSNFIKTMLNVGKKHDTVRVVSDQIGTPTYTLDLARLLVDMRNRRNTAITMPPTKGAISAGMTLPARSTNRLAMPQEWCRSPLRNTVFPKRHGPSTAVWTNPNWQKTGFNPFLHGRTHCNDI